MGETAPKIAVCPFTIAVDTREQAPYTFEQMRSGGGSVRNAGGPLVVRCERRTLESGDYSIVGMEGLVAIERKSLEDLYATLGSGRERFEREFERLNELAFAAVVVEADLRECWRPKEFHPNWRSRLNPRSVEGTIVAWSIRYSRVHWWMMGSRRPAEVRTFKVLEAFWREQEAKAKTKAKENEEKAKG